MNKNMRILATLILSVILAFIGAQTLASTPAGTVVTRVVDGDTIHALVNGDDETIRFIGIDTPETHGRGGLRECYGQEATNRTMQLLPKGTPIRIEVDRERRDRYGRLLGYVYREEDNAFINLLLAEEGFATTLTISPNTAHSGEFSRAVSKAELTKKGLWGSCGSPDVKLN